MSAKKRPAREAERHPSRPARKPVSQTPAWVAPLAVVAALAVLIGAFLVYRWYTTPLPPKPLPADTTQQVVSDITTLPASTFEKVGAGTADNRLQRVSGPPLTGSTGKPEILYVGGEFCPFCAAERWPMIIALSRFGTFAGLKTTTSSSSDVYANTSTFTFHGATYASQYIEFHGVETTDRDQNQLDSLSAGDQAVFGKYDTAGTIPFVDLGNRYVLSGATYSPDTLVGKTWQDISNSLKDPASSQARAIIGSANLITAAICKLTTDQPSDVCSSATVQSLESKLG